MTSARVRLVRAELGQLRMTEIVTEAREAAAAGDEQRVAALEAESRLILQNLREIRREQLMADLVRNEQAARSRSVCGRPWWRRLLGLS